MKVEELKGKLSLKNSGELQVVFIGVGSAFAKKNKQNNFLIIKGDTHILVDFGAKGQDALLEATGLDLTDIEVLLPTHSHSDHIGGIEALALMNRYVGQKFMKKSKLKMVITEEYQRILWEDSLKGGMERNEELDEKPRLYFTDYFDIIRPKWKTHQPRETFEVQVGDIHLELFRTKHIPEGCSSWEDSFVSYGMLIDGHVFISGDTRFDQDLIDLYKNRASVMFHDVQLFEPENVHATLDSLRVLPPEVKEKMLLMHYGDNWEEHDVSDFAGWAKAGMVYSWDKEN